MQPRRAPAALGLALAAGLLAGCSGTPGGGPTPSPDVPPSLRELPLMTVSLDGRTLRVAVADTNATRQRGLTGVADLGPLDGLLFAYPAPTETSFHMRNVPIPLDIAFFAADGHLLSVTAMATCAADPCPSYRAPAAFRWALEAPAGALVGLPVDARLSLGP